MNESNPAAPERDDANRQDAGFTAQARALGGRLLAENERRNSGARLCFDVLRLAHRPDEH